MERKEKTCVETAMPVAGPPPDEGMRELALVGVAAEQAGWTVEQGFEAAWMLRLHGTPAHVSIAAFLHAARWLQ
jgi:hypothetical protein